MNKWWWIVLLLSGLLGVRAQILVSSAGATFPYRIYSQWFDDFHRLHPDTEIRYQALGSGAGLRQLQAGLVDFAASDRPFSDRELSAFGQPVLHFPTVVGAVVPIYNLPNTASELNFTAEALAGILLGDIRTWDDPALAAANPGVALPNARIVPVQRADESGTAYILGDFLSKTSERWREAIRGGRDVWESGPHARGSEGMAALVKQTRYSFGYLELGYAVRNRLTYGRVQNSSRKFVRAELATIRAAAESMAGAMPPDFRISITNSRSERAYPIASYTWLLTPAVSASPAKQRAIADFLAWMLVNGRKSAERDGYVALPEAVASQAMAACRKLEP